tara:strand:- start:37139 stop:42688 length:5550 start_codon:yes stop_codon:yes gene_type:complete
MKCFNKSTPEYQALKSKYKSVTTVDSIINGWQLTTETDEIPTVSDVEVMMQIRRTAFGLKKREFAKSVLANLSRKKWISRLGNDYYVNKSSALTRSYDASVTAKNIKNIQEYLRFKNIPLDTVNIQRKAPFRISIDPNLFTKSDILQESRENDGTHTADIIAHMARMFPQVNIEVVTVAAAKEYYDNLPTWQKAKVPFSQIKSYYVDGQVRLIKGRATLETSIEEILHPFIDGVKVDNEALFNGLLKEARKNFPQLSEQIKDTYTELRGFNQTERDLELVTQALSRHFNKEYKEKPTVAWIQKIKELLEWFRNIINDFHKYLTGKGIKPGDISANATMTDIARLLNTEDLEFTIERVVDKKVRYSLKPEKQQILDNIMDQSNEVQRALIKKMFHLATTSKKDVKSLTANVREQPDVGSQDDRIVVLNEEDHVYYDLETGEQYTSVTNAIKGEFKDSADKQLNLDLGNDFDAIADGLAAGLSYNDILPRLKIIHKSLDEQGVSNAYVAYNQLLGAIETIKHNGSVIIPQVVFSDANAKIAGTADLVVISPEGRIGIIDLKSGKNPVKSPQHDTLYDLKSGILKEKLGELGMPEKLSTRQQHGIQVNTYRRMVENMGYEVLDTQSFGIATLHLNVDIEGKGTAQVFKDKFVFDGWVNHAPSANEPFVNMIVPIIANEISEAHIDAIAAAAGTNNPVKDDDFLGDEELPEDIENAGTLFDVVYKALTDFKVGLIKRKEAIELMRDGIFLDKTRQEHIDQIENTMSMVNIALDEGPTSLEVIYTELLQDSLKEVKKFIEYIEDAKNYNKPEYINYVLNFSRFIETYRGLYSVKEAGVLNKTQGRLVLKLISELNKLEGVRKGEPGLIDVAIDNYVRSYVIDNTNRDFTEEDLDELMTMAKDMGAWEYATYDLDSSSDTIVALMSKLHKRKVQEVLDRVDTRNDITRATLSKLVKLSPKNKVDYSFMLQEDESRYIREIGYDYWKMGADLRGELFDDAGVWMEYIFIEDLETARPEDVAFNKELFKKKKKYREFLRAERKGTDGPLDGEYHRYTKEFKEERARYQQYNNIGNGYWERKKGVSDMAYQRFLAKNFDTIETSFATYDSNNEFTGVTRIDTMQVPKRKHNEIRSIAADGKDMRDSKWVKIMTPTNALEEAQKEFYLMFRQQYEEELLAKLPMSVRDDMLGKIPLVKDNLYDELKGKPNIVARLWAKSTRTATDFFTMTGTSKKVMTDANGNFIDTLPIFYVGSPRNEKALKNIEDKIVALKKGYNMGKVSSIAYKTKKAELEQRRATIIAQPTRDEISKDLGDSLLRFSAMAENYEVMGTIEDTLTAMIKTLEKREYNPASGTKLMSRVKGTMEEVGVPGVSTGGEALMVKRVKKWMKMVYYDNDKTSKSWVDKVVSGLVRYSSLSYVAFNPFGNINNYTIARINNAIETAGGRFYDARAYARATLEFNKRALPDVVRKTAFLAKKKPYEKYIPRSKWEALVNYYRMMDAKSDIREAGQFEKKESWLKKSLDFGYIMQDAAEYNVQTKVGMAVLMTRQIKNSKTGETLSLYDAYTLNGDGSVTMKDGYDVLLDKDGKEIKEMTDTARYDIHNEIREVNKQIHGNYAHQDRMVIQAYALGELAAQFHKWVVPAIKARFRGEYFDENVGWLEGRYLSMWSFVKYAVTHMGEVQKWGTNFQEQHGAGERAKMKMLNVWRATAELGLMMSSYIMASILSNLFEDDDDDSVTQRRLENALIYQADRAHKEMVQFMPFLPSGAKQIYQMVKSPIASTRTLGELAEAISATMDYGYGKMFLTDKEFRTNSTYVYQNKPRKGQSKLAKQWFDAVPVLYGIQRWEGYDREKDFEIR